jgi:hypothetical protein
MCSLNATHLKGSKAKLGMPEPARVCTIDGSPVDFNIFKGDCETFHCTGLCPHRYYFVILRFYFEF